MAELEKSNIPYPQLFITKVLIVFETSHHKDGMWLKK